MTKWQQERAACGRDIYVDSCRDFGREVVSCPRDGGYIISPRPKGMAIVSSLYVYEPSA